METEKLLEIIKIQSEILEVLCKKYLDDNRNPIEKKILMDLRDTLRDAQKSIT
jgi:hypothetical protein